MGRDELCSSSFPVLIHSVSRRESGTRPRTATALLGLDQERRPRGNMASNIVKKLSEQVASESLPQEKGSAENVERNIRGLPAEGHYTIMRLP